jgi:hypothetical protein
MRTLLRALMVTAGTVFIIAPAKAETVPADTAAFVSFCTGHFESCRDRLLTIDNMMRLGMGGNHKCAFPRTAPTEGGGSTLHADSIAATTAILAWLNTNSASRSQETDGAIEQAKQALWPELCAH